MGVEVEEDEEEGAGEAAYWSVLVYLSVPMFGDGCEGEYRGGFWFS